MGFPKPHIDRDARELNRSPSEPLQSFVIPVSDTQAYRQFGNAVVVDVIEHLARALAAQTQLVATEQTGAAAVGA
jgi:site-specific DNA-cytosine methylase